MIFVVGLGNTGLKYETTRHNIGFEVVERFAYDHNIKLDMKKHRAIIGQGIVGGEKVIVAKPQTYMNDSGISIRSMLDFYKEDAGQVIVVYDDTSLELGGLRIRKNGSAGGHNGVKSIISHLGTDTFDRVKVGVGEKPPGYDLANYVLSRFTKSEIEVMIETVKHASDAITTMIKADTITAMNQYNRKNVSE